MCGGERVGVEVGAGSSQVVWEEDGGNVLAFPQSQDFVGVWK